jgi:hypothetical protein
LPQVSTGVARTLRLSDGTIERLAQHTHTVVRLQRERERERTCVQTL